MSTGCTRGQQNDDDDNDENNHHVLTAAAATTPQRLRRRRRHAGATTTATLPWAALVLFLSSPRRGAAEGFESYSGWSSRSRQVNDGPVETELRREGFRQGFVGCLHQEDLCNDDEICLDDSLFGRCLTEFDGANIDEYRDAYDLQDLSSSDASLLRLELEQLSSAGFQWADPYTQCVLQNTITAILNDLSFDEAECDLFLPASERLSGEEISLVGPNDDLYPGAVAFDHDDGGDGEEEVVVGEGETPEMFVVPGESTEGIVSSVVPKKMPALDLEDDQSPLEAGESVIRVDEQPDGSLVVEQQSDDAALFDDFLGRMNSISEQTGATDFEDIIPVLQQEIPGLVVYEVEDDTDDNDTDGEEKYIDEDDDDEPSVEDFHDVEDYMKSVLDAVESEHEQNQRLGKRGLEAVPQRQSIRPEDLLYDDPTYDTDYAEMYYDDDMTDQPRRSEELEPQGENPQLGLGSIIFNRRGRLDVKKPGPFYPKSANNFFFDKIDYADDGDRQERRNDTGQVEYEMPLLAPPPTTNSNDQRKGGADLADRLELEDETPELPEEKADKPEFVHIATKRRLRTWGQGKDFIGYLADHFGVPREALTDRRIEQQHVQFHVAPNPNSVDAVHMAKRIDEDADLRRQIDDDLGVDVDRAAAGHRDDVGRALFPPGTNFNLALLLVVAVSSAAACLVAATALLVCRRRRERTGRLDKIRRADDDIAERGKAQEEYKQLCRDWSKSGRKVDAASAMRNSPDSNSNDRSSSTSSYPGSEEPVPNAATKMDISTGHMVLAYMEDHLKNKQRLEQEWVALCGYEAEPCATTIAFKAENKKKNRYPDKLPYDHNRVILNAMVNATSSDYINASTVTDSDPRNPSYIVTQAPLSTTVADFWQMIWEQGCVVIVMLTRLQDNGLQMCHRYWPEEGSEQYHIFEVHLVSEHIWCDDYLVRSVYLKNTRTGETRTVTQFHFRSWPSLGVPTSTRALLEFRRKVNKSYRGRSCPIAVHCSDGVGRAGTYILIDMVLNRMSKGCKEIDIAATLEHIRDQRGGGMVQSRGQFEFCLMAVAEEVHAILKALPQ